MTVSHTVSAAHTLAIAARVPPTATRIASSRVRSATRVSIRPDTFAHAISSSTPTAPNSTHIAWRAGPMW